MPTSEASRIVAAAVAVLGSFAAAVLPAPAQQIFRSGVDVIIVPVSVRSGNRPVSGLKREDFELRDNGVLQTLSDAAAESVPIDLTVLLDLSSSVNVATLRRLKGAVSETAALLQPEDRIRLLSVSQVLREVFAFRSGREPLPLEDLGPEGATSLYDALCAAMMQPTEPGRRQLIIAFTDGRDSTSVLDETATKAIARLTDAVVNIVIPVPDAAPGQRRLTQRPGSVDAVTSGENVVVNGQRRGGTAPDVIPAVLEEVVAPTAGAVVPLPPEASISRTFRTLLETFRASYVLQYVPQRVAPDGWHDVTVSVKGDRYQVQARRGYRGKGKIGSAEERQ